MARISLCGSLVFLCIHRTRSSFGSPCCCSLVRASLIFEIWSKRASPTVFGSLIFGFSIIVFGNFLVILCSYPFIRFVVLWKMLGKVLALVYTCKGSFVVILGILTFFVMLKSLHLVVFVFWCRVSSGRKKSLYLSTRHIEVATRAEVALWYWKYIKLAVRNTPKTLRW